MAHTQLTKDKISESKIRHGFSKRNARDRFYTVWENVKKRCNNPNRHNYKYYGGRGIKCLWDKFEDFKKDMHTEYLKHIKLFGDKDTFIDRINSNGDYCKENCRWSTKKENMRHKSNSYLITYQNKTLSLAEWCDRLNMNYYLAHLRLRRGWSFERAIKR